MTLEDENALLPSNVEHDVRCYIGSTYVFVVSYNKTFPFFILYTHLSKTALVVID